MIYSCGYFFLRLVVLRFHTSCLSVSLFLQPLSHSFSFSLPCLFVLNPLSLLCDFNVSFTLFFSVPVNVNLLLSIVFNCVWTKSVFYFWFVYFYSLFLSLSLSLSQSLSLTSLSLSLSSPFNVLFLEYIYIFFPVKMSVYNSIFVSSCKLSILYRLSHFLLTLSSLPVSVSVSVSL